MIKTFTKFLHNYKNLIGGIFEFYDKKYTDII